MTREPERPRDEFEALRDAYRSRMPARIAEIRASAREAQRAGASVEAVERLCHLAHRLVGSAAIYGFPCVSDAARALEALASRLLDGAAEAESLDELTRAVEVAWRETGSSARRGPLR